MENNWTVYTSPDFQRWTPLFTNLTHSQARSAMRSARQLGPANHYLSARQERAPIYNDKHNLPYAVSFDLPSPSLTVKPQEKRPFVARQGKGSNN